MENLSNRRRKGIARLTRRRYRERQGEYLIEGARAVASALEAAAPLVDMVVTEGALEDPRIRQLAEGREVPVYLASADEFSQLTDVETPQGILAAAKTQWTSEEKFLQLPRVLALDGLQDPGNVGTILRTAAWFGVEGIVSGPGTVDLYHPKVVRAAMGGIWDVALAQSGDLPGLMRAAKAEQFTCCGADLEGTPVSEWQPVRPSMLIFGNEAHGLSGEVQELLDERLVIAGAADSPGAESLNVSVAAGIMLYAWDR